MIRLIYRLVLWLHPPAFRRQYADEMLWIFGICRAERGARSLIADAILSLLRQWILRTRWWLVPVAVVWSLVTLLGGNAVLHYAFRRMVRGRTGTPQELFLLGTAISVVMICLAVIIFVNTQLRARRNA
jgi:hypothetical protein